MSRHYSKVLIELPDSPSDPPYAVISIECEQCDKTEIRIHVAHLGTVGRVIDQTVQSLFSDDGFTESMRPFFIPSTPDNKKKIRDYLNSFFPGWAAGRAMARRGEKGNA